jgi:hypothetical protein
LAPAMLDSVMATKLLKSLTDDQIEAFIASGAADAAQAKLLKVELERRRKEAAKKKDGTDGKRNTEEKTQSPKPRESSVADSPQ